MNMYTYGSLAAVVGFLIELSGLFILSMNVKHQVLDSYKGNVIFWVFAVGIIIMMSGIISFLYELEQVKTLIIGGISV